LTAEGGGRKAREAMAPPEDVFGRPFRRLAATRRVTRDPGRYAVQVSGVGGTTGEALVEIYEVP
jgi:hypothetical protein